MVDSCCYEVDIDGVCLYGCVDDVYLYGLVCLCVDCLNGCVVIC